METLVTLFIPYVTIGALAAAILAFSANIFFLREATRSSLTDTERLVDQKAAKINEIAAQTHRLRVQLEEEKIQTFDKNAYVKSLRDIQSMLVSARNIDWLIENNRMPWAYRPWTRRIIKRQRQIDYVIDDTLKELREIINPETID